MLKHVSQIGWMLVLVIPLALLLASVGGYWLSGRALAPVTQAVAKEGRGVVLYRKFFAFGLIHGFGCAVCVRAFFVDVRFILAGFRQRVLRISHLYI